ncbi:hypothetical protein CPB86DRAFT_297479 [Serendipita vermifera]|nr:hypothetical protein CPB86DRAFT_297479 [Serendipita vermifera]
MGLAISGPTDFQHITGGLNALQQSGPSPFPGATTTSSSSSIGARTAAAGGRGAEMSKAELASAYNPSRQKGDDQTMRRGDLTSGATLNRPVVGSNNHISSSDSSSGNGIRGAGGAADVWATFETEVGEGNATSPRAIRQKYSFDFNTLESGLSGHMDTMRNGHKSPQRQSP